MDLGGVCSVCWALAAELVLVLQGAQNLVSFQEVNDARGVGFRA